MGSRVLVLLALAGCYQPPTDSCRIRCQVGDDSACPGDLTCGADGFCTNGDESCTTELAMISVGARHVCGLDAAGRVLCWGDNHLGQLGIADSTSETAPRFITDDSERFITVAAGGEHSCALRDDGRVLCWGNNTNGESIGARGGTIMTPTLVSVSMATPPPPLESITAGGSHSCAIGAGELWCWGERDFLGFASDVSFMTRIGTRNDWTMASLGMTHSCGIAGGELLCWGTNNSGEAGGSISPFVTTPTPITISGKVPIYVGAGNEKTCGIYATAADAPSGELWCWGKNEQHEIEPATNTPVTSPRQIGTSAGWSSVTAGAHGICGIRDGNALCWGMYYQGGGGDGHWDSARTADEAVDLGPADEVALVSEAQYQAAGDLGCLRNGSDVACWGSNLYGEVGFGVLGSLHPEPVAIASPNGQPWRNVVTGHHHTCAQTMDGALWCWGADSYGQITAAIPRGGDVNPCIAGEPCDFATPRAAAPTQLTNADEIATTRYATCARQGGTIVCWGVPWDGVLGISSGDATINTVAPPQGQQWADLFGGDEAMCARTTANVLACWGRLPDASTYSPTIQDDIFLQMTTQLQFGDDFACGARSDGARTCWGHDEYAQLGDGIIGTTVSSPALYTNAQVMFVAAHQHHACAITSTSGIACWGDNSRGSAGQPPVTSIVTTPTQVSTSGGPLTGCTEVAMSDVFGCAICNGTPYCWGSNYGFELGRGYAADRSPDYRAAPVKVPSGSYSSIALGSDHGCVVNAAGELYCWGYGKNGEIGDGSHGVNYPTPIARAR